MVFQPTSRVPWARGSGLAAVIVALAAGSPNRALGGEPGTGDTAAPQNDFLFPGAGRVSLTGMTGLPYAALGELSLGIGDHAALGGFVAGGPFLGGVAIGLNPRALVTRFGRMRLVAEAPFAWYPDLQNTNTWILAHPDLRVEASLGPLRLHMSAGMLAAKMLGAPAVPGPIEAYGGAGGLPSGVQQGAVWNTLGTGGALSLDPRTSIFVEGFLILRGDRLAGPEWFDLPFAAFVGVATTLSK